MDPLLVDFRRGPTAYLSSRGISSQNLVDEILQLLMTPSDKNDAAKLAALGVFQEMAPSLFTDPTRLETTVTTLKTIFQQHRATGSPLICSQILCSMTTVIIEMESVVERDYLMVELIQLLFDVVEKIKSDTNLLVRAAACDCLRELELAYPGLLSSKIGHFYGMSQAENCYIFQHYLLLLATVLEHTVQKHVLSLELDHTPDSTLSDLLSHADTLKAYSLPDDFRRAAKHLLSKAPSKPLGEEVECSDVRRAVSFILDYYQLLTPACLALTLSKVVSTVQLTSLTPKILKSVLLHYLSCQDLLPFYLVLSLKWKFGEDICTEGDADSIKMWLTLMACHPCLSAHHRELLLSYYLQWPQAKAPSELATTESEGDEEMEGGGGGEKAREYRQVLFPSVFDTYDTYCYKVKALNFRLDIEDVHSEAFPSSPLPHLLHTVLKQVQYGIEGAPIVTLFRLLYSYYVSCQQYASESSELSKLVAGVVKDHPKYIPHTINFITALQTSFPDSPLPLQLLADYLQFLSTVPLSPLLPQLPLFLLFLKQAALHPSINPLVVIQFLSRVLQDPSLCEAGSWDIGTAMLTIVNSIMRRQNIDSIFKGLTDLLELVSAKYNDIDIQDRARFYHQLLLSVSGEKLSAILALASDSSTGSTLSDIVEARIADNTYPSAPPVKTIADKFLSLTRVYTSEEPYYQNTDSSDSTATVVEEYVKALGEGDGQRLSFSLHYQIHFLHCPEGVSERVYAAVLRLTSSAPYHACPDVYIPYLACKDSGAPANSSSKAVTFTFFPKQPVPAVFRASAIFTTEEGLTCMSDLGNIEVEFGDLFQPLPPLLAPQQVSSGEMFRKIWANIESTQQPKSGGERFGVLSTVHLDLSWKEWEHRAKRLQLLQIPSNTDLGPTASGRCSTYLVFLPPRYHLLLKLSCVDSGVSVLLATDCWRALGLVNDHLHSLSTGTSDS